MSSGVAEHFVVSSYNSECIGSDVGVVANMNSLLVEEESIVLGNDVLHAHPQTMLNNHEHSKSCFYQNMTFVSLKAFKNWENWISCWIFDKKRIYWPKYAPSGQINFRFQFNQVEKLIAYMVKLILSNIGFCDVVMATNGSLTAWDGQIVSRRKYLLCGQLGKSFQYTIVFSNFSFWLPVYFRQLQSIKT